MFTFQQSFYSFQKKISLFMIDILIRETQNEKVIYLVL